MLETGEGVTVTCVTTESGKIYEDAVQKLERGTHRHDRNRNEEIGHGDAR